MASNGEPRPFTLHVADDAIVDLKRRLSATRFPDEAPGSGWRHGADLSWMRKTIGYWRDEFDWRAQETRLNAFPNYKVAFDDVDLHFIHAPGVGPSPTPLLISHGWPGSIFEFLDLIPRLTDPARFGGSPDDAFTVIAPSLPGYGLSFAPGQTRFGVTAMAEIFLKLMSQVLGYDRFAAHGGDWGSLVSSTIASLAPERVIGLHLNLLLMPREAMAALGDSDEDKAYRREFNRWRREETGYLWIQGTRPQTLAYALTDSPAGLAAWILEKFRAWSGDHAPPDEIFDRDALLANVALYWFTGAIGSSFWPYYDRLHAPWPWQNGDRITVPTGYAAFPAETLHPPRAMAARFFSDLRRWTEMPQGGHFAAMERPDDLAREIRVFFRPLRSG